MGASAHMPSSSLPHLLSLGAPALVLDERSRRVCLSSLPHHSTRSAGSCLSSLPGGPRSRRGPGGVWWCLPAISLRSFRDQGESACHGGSDNPEPAGMMRNVSSCAARDDYTSRRSSKQCWGGQIVTARARDTGGRGNGLGSCLCAVGARPKGLLCAPAKLGAHSSDSI